MKRFISFVKTTLLGGLVVILPATIIAGVFTWLYRQVTDLIQPLTNFVMEKSSLREYIADIAVIGLIVGFCFFLGIIVKTSVGRFIQEKLENKLAKFAPGYSLVKETVLQFLGRTKSPFSSVVLVQIYENQTLATGFLTDEHEGGIYTVFVPTGPNPTSGQIFHVRSQFVHPVEVGIEDAMRSIISCGAGSGRLIDSYLRKEEK